MGKKSTLIKAHDRCARTRLNFPAGRHVERKSIFAGCGHTARHYNNDYTYFRNELREHRWCSGIMQDSHSCDSGSIPGRCKFFAAKNFFVHEIIFFKSHRVVVKI